MQTVRMSKRLRGRWWVVGAALAAGSMAVAYFFDPDKGKGRRIEVLERSGHAARTTSRRLRREARYAFNTLRARTEHLLALSPQRYVDDRTLLDRVESELFVSRSIPRGRLTFEVEGTTVILRGQLDSIEETHRIEEAVRKLPGVTAVTSLLHLPGTPAPNKAEALAASKEATVRPAARRRKTTT
jgi:hypothetical protein